MGHSLVYHTTEGDYNAYGSLNRVEESLVPAGFSRCNSCYLVNLRYVKRIDGFTAFIGSEEEAIPSAMPRRRTF